MWFHNKGTLVNSLAEGEDASLGGTPESAQGPSHDPIAPWPHRGNRITAHSGEATGQRGLEQSCVPKDILQDWLVAINALSVCDWKLQQRRGEGPLGRHSQDASPSGTFKNEFIGPREFY